MLHNLDISRYLFDPFPILILHTVHNFLIFICDLSSRSGSGNSGNFLDNKNGQKLVLVWRPPTDRMVNAYEKHSGNHWR